MNATERRAHEAQRRGKRAGNAGQPAVGAREVRAGLAELGWREDGGAPALYRTLAARLVVTLALLEAEQGRAEYGLRLLDHAERDVAESDRGHLHSQRGVILLRMGRWAAALTELATAEPLAASDPELLATVLLNRSVLHLNTFNVQLARDDLKRCALVAAEGRQALLAAKATQNLGYCDLLGGDIPAALQRFDVAARAYQAIAPGILPGLEIDRARALLAAGLAGEAATSLDAAVTALRRQHRDQMLAEAELSRARAAQTAGDLAEARHWASLAVRRFRARGNHPWAALAELTRVSASFDAVRVPDGTPDPMTARTPDDVPAKTSGSHRAYARIATQAQQVAAQLRAHGLPTDAVLADLTAARALAAARRPADAARCLATIQDRRGLPLDAVLLRQLARAELAAGAGRTDAALAELRSGLATVHARRGQLGSLDLQTGAAALGAELADLGLRLMLARRLATPGVQLDGTVTGAIVPYPSDPAADRPARGRGAHRTASAQLHDQGRGTGRGTSRRGAPRPPHRAAAATQGAQLGDRRTRRGARHAGRRRRDRRARSRGTGTGEPRRPQQTIARSDDCW